MTNYASMASRIRSCKSRNEFRRVEQSTERVYLAGTLTVNEYSRLDALLVDCMIATMKAKELAS